MSNILNNTTSLQEVLELLQTKAAGGGIDTNDATATADDILQGETAYVKGQKVTGTIPTKTSSDLIAAKAIITVPSGYYATDATKSVGTTTQATPTISVDSAGKITATATQSAGYVSAGTKTGTKQLTTKSATTYTPSTSNQIIASGTYLTGTQTIKGDSNLKAENIKSGVTIFNVTGTATSGGGADTSDATATADEIFAGKTAYGASGKVTGTFTIDAELAAQNSLIPQIRNALKGKALPPGSAANPTAPKKDVNFYDYDGTRLYSYTVEEAQVLTELPPLPTQPGLVCQEWNYDLETIKSYNRAMDIGATYITDDGKTRLYIKIATEGRMNVPLYFSQTASNGVTIDWGDGSAIQTLSGTGIKNTTHTYTSIGDYVISLNVASGCTLGLGHNSSSACVLGSEKVYLNMLQKIEIGNEVTSIGSYAFNNCYSLASIIIPDSVTSIGSYAFNNCYSLASIIIPDSVTSIDSYAFYYCYSLASIIIPNSVTSISNSTFQECRSLTSITIPNSVTSIGSYAFTNCFSLASIIIPDGVAIISTSTFNNCYSLASIIIPDSVISIGNSAFKNCSGMAFCDFTSHTSIPTLSNTNAFTGIPSDCIIKVPAALYDEWMAATNWSTYANQIVAV